VAAPVVPEDVAGVLTTIVNVLESTIEAIRNSWFKEAAGIPLIAVATPEIITKSPT
jgi:hypothetical protein